MTGTVDIDKMARIVERLIMVPVARQFGRPGIQTLQALITGVRKIYGEVSTERLPHGITVVAKIAEESTRLLDGGVEIRRSEMLLTYADGPLTIELIGERQVWAVAAATQPTDFADSALVYRWHPVEGEHVFLCGEAHELPNPSGAPAVLAMPYFIDLGDALDHFHLHKARRPGQCAVLKEAWRDDCRLMLAQKPEVTMRKSLHAYLISGLRNYRSVEVMAEQIVDESHPVDLKITWLNTNKVAIIEIKWMGKSAPSGQARPLTSYGDARAVEGARQLAEYLNSYATYSPSQDVRGYLVVFDARRRSVSPNSTSVSRANGFYYSTREVEYPAEVIGRGDFAPPVRLFCEPRTTD